MDMRQRRVNLDRETPFSFACRRCRTCCRNKKIQVNPYEITRLARNRGLSTSDFIKRYTTEAGTCLTWDAEGRCLFLGSRGCMVHKDRPLVCRLYPLGRHVTPTLQESFSEFEPDPACRGVYGTDATVCDYLDAQRAHPFMAAADKYLQLFWKLCDILQKDVANHQAMANALAKPSCAAAEPYDILRDVDRAVSDFCKREQIARPLTIENELVIHIRAIEDWAGHSMKGGKNEGQIDR